MTTVDKFTDPRDGQSYRIAKMKDNRWWLAENFRFVCEESFQADPRLDHDAHSSQASQLNYGRFYSKLAAVKHCPTGWRVPTLADWRGLIAPYGRVQQEQPHSGPTTAKPSGLVRQMEEDGFALDRVGTGYGGSTIRIGGNVLATFLASTSPEEHYPMGLSRFAQPSPERVWFLAFSEEQAFECPEHSSFWFSVRYVKL